jgi:hypothetical protein
VQTLGQFPHALGQQFFVLGQLFRTLGTPLHALGLPFRVLGQPLHALGVPLHALGVPFYALGLPFYVLGRPFRVLGLPLHMLGVPLHAFSRAIPRPSQPFAALGQDNRTLGFSPRSVSAWGVFLFLSIFLFFPRNGGQRVRRLLEGGGRLRGRGRASPASLTPDSYPVGYFSNFGNEGFMWSHGCAFEVHTSTCGLNQLGSSRLAVLIATM